MKKADKTQEWPDKAPMWGPENVFGKNCTQESVNSSFPNASGVDAAFVMVSASDDDMIKNGNVLPCRYIIGICASRKGEDSRLLLGHCWITLIDLAGNETFAYGLWTNDHEFVLEGDTSRCDFNVYTNIETNKEIVVSSTHYTLMRPSDFYLLSRETSKIITYSASTQNCAWFARHIYNLVGHDSV